jgi:hypothetical protein
VNKSVKWKGRTRLQEKRVEEGTSSLDRSPKAMDRSSMEAESFKGKGEVDEESIKKEGGGGG